MKVYRDTFIGFDEHDCGNDDIFRVILEQRKNSKDKDRFFLKFIPQENLDAYDLNSPVSAKRFREECVGINPPLMFMGGFNMDSNCLSADIRNAGIKMSDPYGKICGSFDIRNGIITYSPIFPRFYEERDLIKFADDEYFTTATFEEIMMQQISLAKGFRLHIGNYRSVKDIVKHGKYVLENISKEQMIEFVTNLEQGAKVLRKTFNI